MRLFLTSAGLIPETRADFITLLGKDTKTTKAVFIPTAATNEEEEYYNKLSLSELEELGIQTDIVDLKHENEISLPAKLADKDIIYVNGGNTFFLLHWVRKSGFDKLIANYLKNGALYVGTSAGSILAGPDIAVCAWSPDWDKNTVDLKNTTGLGLVPFAICPHYEEKDHNLLLEKSREVDYPVIALNDTQAVSVDGNLIKVVGVGKKVRFG